MNDPPFVLIFCNFINFLIIIYAIIVPTLETLFYGHAETISPHFCSDMNRLSI